MPKEKKQAEEKSQEGPGEIMQKLLNEHSIELVVVPRFVHIGNGMHATAFQIVANYKAKEDDTKPAAEQASL